MTREIKHVCVIGAGSWGTALSLLLARQGVHVYLWTHEVAHREQMIADRVNAAYLPDAPFPDTLQICSDLPAALAACQDVLIVVPSHAFDIVCDTIAPLLTPDHAVMWGTKGLHPGTCQPLHVTAKEKLGADRAYAVISGPSFAKEVAAGLPTAVCVGATDDAYAETVQRCLMTDDFRVYINNDLVGLSVCGTVKNVIAIAAGMSDGVGYGANTRSALITRGLSEMARLVHAMEGSSQTVYGLGGAGDLILTCGDDLSRNRRFGLKIGQGVSCEQALKDIGQAVEGYGNAKQLKTVVERLSLDCPILSMLYQVLYDAYPIEKAVHELMTRPMRLEA